MARIDDLIRACKPHGVEYKQLGEVGTFIRGNGLQKKDLLDAGVLAIHYGQVHTAYAVWTTETISYVAPEFAARLRKAEPGDLVIATTSEDDEAVAKATAWLGQTDAAVSGDAYIYRHTLEPKYVAYFFQSEHFHNQKRIGITGTKVRRISGASLAKIRIPVPPREVQQEIVRVLDAFAELVANLEAELEARGQQYSYYRGRLVTFSYSGEIRWTTLGEVASVRVGQTPAADALRDDGEFPFVNAGTTASGRATTHNTPGGTVTIPSRGQGGVGIVGYQTDDFWCGPLCYRIRSAQRALSTRFLYYFLKSVQPSIRALQQTGGTPALNMKELVTVRVPLPTVDEQERVVRILDNFDLLVNDLSSGLPAEIEARRQQYAYYRDRLLSFKDMAA